MGRQCRAGEAGIVDRPVQRLGRRVKGRVDGPDALAVGRWRLRRAGKLSLEVQRLGQSGRYGEREKRGEDENASHWGPPLLRRHERLFYAKRIRRNAPSWITRQSIPPWVAFA